MKKTLSSFFERLKNQKIFNLPAVTLVGIIVGTASIVWFSPARAEVEIVTDSFTRSASNGWGTATSGQSYSTNGGNAADYAVNGNQGTVTFSAANASKEVFLGTVSTTNAYGLMKVKIDKTPTGSSPEVQFIARRVASNTNYRIRLIFSTGGNTGLLATKVVGGSASQLASQVNVSITPTADQYVWFKAEATGTSPTTIRSKVWVDGQSEPASWQYSTTDSQAELQTAGAVGIRTNVPNGFSSTPMVFSVDSLAVTDTDLTPTPSPTPSPSPTPEPYNNSTTYSPDEFIQADGKNLTFRGENIILKGTNFDNVPALGASIGSGDIDDIQITEADYQELRAQGGNHARLGLSFNWYQSNKVEFYEMLDTHIGWAREHGVWIVLNMFTTPDNCYEGYGTTCDIWTTPAEQEELEEFWVEVAQRYYNEPVIAGYDLLNEPTPPAPDYCETWFDIASEIRDAVYAEAPNQLVFIAACSDPGNSLRFRDPPFGDNIVYEVHDYTPISLTHSPSGEVYPGESTDTFGTCTYNKEAFQGIAQSGDPAGCADHTNLYEVYGLDWGDDNNVPIYIGEWGAESTLNGYVQFHQDKAELYQDWGVNHAHYTWKHNTIETDTDDVWGIYSNPLRLDDPLKLAAVQIAWQGSIFMNGTSGTISSTSSTNSSFSAPVSEGCSYSPPQSAPDLFQINRQGSQATLYIAPASGEHNSYFIAFGLGSVTEQFGVEFNQADHSGVFSYAIYDLDPKATYSFKVRAGNHCKPGDWSSVLKTSGTKGSNPVIFYK